MEKRFILFIFLSLLFMFFYPYLIEKLRLVPPPQPPKQTPRPPNREVHETRGQEGIPPTSAPMMTSAEVEDRAIEVKTALYHAVFSSRGGRLVRWELKSYTTADGTHRIKLYEERPGMTPAFSIQTSDAGLNDRLRQGLYAVEGEDIALSERRRGGQISFHYADPQTGQQISKRFTFSDNDYRVVLEIEASGFPEGYALSVGSDFGITDWQTAGGGFVGFIGPITYVNDQAVKDTPSKINGKVRHEGRIGWAALQDKYFIAAAIPTEATAVTVSRPGAAGIDTALEFTPKGPGPWINRLILYAGPKEHDRLKSLGVKLEETVDFGWFIYGSWAIVRFLAEPLFYVLRFFHGFLGNYGVAIILLTVSVRVLFIPLSHKSYRSMKGLQTLQPQLQALQKKHKDDRPRLQREMMGLYQKNKVNPMGGCLPMLLQVPVFVALFNVLYTTIELRQAPFLLWIRDLSTQDPYYVLPILMGITMAVQMKMQPTTMDPTQAKLMMLMPVFMSFLFLTLPSGLVVYMLTNNVLTMGQQYFTMKVLERPHENEKSPGKTPTAQRDKP